MPLYYGKNSPLLILNSDISSIIADYLPKFKRKKFWEDLGDNVRKIVNTKSSGRNNIPSEIILCKLDGDHRKILLNKMDNIYMNDYSYGLYYIYSHYVSLFKSEYWDFNLEIGGDDEYITDNVKLKEGITYDMIPYYKKYKEKYGTYNTKLLFKKHSGIGAHYELEAITKNNEFREEENKEYLCKSKYIDKIIEGKHNDNKLTQNDKRIIIEHLEEWKTIYYSLKDLVEYEQSKFDEDYDYYDYVVSNCEEKINDINDLVKDIKNF